MYTRLKKIELFRNAKSKKRIEETGILQFDAY